MQWNLDGSFIETQDGLLYTPPAADTTAAHTFRLYQPAFTKLHGGKVTKESRRAAGEEYSSSIENDDLRLLSEVFNLMVLSQKDSSLHDGIVSILNKRIPTNLSDDADLLVKMLYDPVETFVREYRARGGTEFVAQMLYQINGANVVAFWRDEIEKASKHRAASDFDRRFVELILSSSYDLGDWCLNLLARTVFNEHEPKLADVLEWSKRIDTSQASPDDIDSLLVLLLSGQFDVFAERVYQVTQDPIFAFHFVDLLEPTKTALEVRELECCRMLELVGTDKTTWPLFGAYLATIKCGPSLSAYIQPKETFFILEGNAADSEFIIQLSSFIDCKRYGDAEDLFNKHLAEQEESVRREAAVRISKIVHEFHNLTQEALILLLEVSMDNKELLPIIERKLIDGIAKCGTIPLYPIS